MYNKIFISYATEDYQYAENLYAFLSENGFEPWMDKINLLPGQNWDFHVQSALRKADFIILLLSKTSVGKRGYVQKEFNQAVIYCEEKLDSDIFIIPIKIDNCVIPNKLSKFQWVEYSSEETNSKIEQAINTQRNLILKENEEKRHRLVGFEFAEKRIDVEYGEKNPKQIIDITYSHFTNTDSESLKEINTLIDSQVLEYLISARENYFDFLKELAEEKDDEQEGGDIFKSDSGCYGTIKFQLIHEKFISYTCFWSLYTTGAAHSNYWTNGSNYLINPLRSVNLESLFDDYSFSLKILRDCIHEKLMKKAKTEFEEDYSDFFYIYEEGLEVNKKNFKNYFFKKDSIVFIYNPYELTAYALGAHHPEVTFEELENLFPEEKKLLGFLNTLRE